MMTNNRWKAALLGGLLTLFFVLPAGAMEKPLTQAESDMTTEGDLPAGCAESKLLDLAADAALEASGSQIVLLPAEAVSGTLEQGAVFESDLERVIPSDQSLVSAQLTVAELRNFLETGVSKLTKDGGDRIDVDSSSWEGFPQMAGEEGFSWEYDVSAPVGERVQYIKWKGEELDLTDTKTTFTVTSVPAMFDGSYGYPKFETVDTGLTLRQALQEYCSARDSLPEPQTRSTAIGTSNYALINKFPKPFIIGICVFLALVISIPKWKAEKLFTFKK